MSVFDTAPKPSARTLGLDWSMSPLVQDIPAKIPEDLAPERRSRGRISIGTFACMIFLTVAVVLAIWLRGEDPLTRGPIVPSGALMHDAYPRGLADMDGALADMPMDPPGCLAHGSFSGVACGPGNPLAFALDVPGSSTGSHSTVGDDALALWVAIGDDGTSPAISRTAPIILGNVLAPSAVFALVYFGSWTLRTVFGLVLKRRSRLTRLSSLLSRTHKGIGDTRTSSLTAIYHLAAPSAHSAVT
ncbi:hypothetical protein C8J57DRAFT_1362601 [Mycena rebaudengoi]|nr:hypothetical protein C8J57DRAFT_1362601 [Mycena rebaudengoi]